MSVGRWVRIGDGLHRFLTQCLRLQLSPPSVSGQHPAQHDDGQSSPLAHLCCSSRLVGHITRSRRAQRVTVTGLSSLSAVLKIKSSVSSHFRERLHKTVHAIYGLFCKIAARQKNNNIQLLPRDAMQARPMPSCGVCLSVTFVHSVKTSNRICRFFFTVG